MEALRVVDGLPGMTAFYADIPSAYGVAAISLNAGKPAVLNCGDYAILIGTKGADGPDPARALYSLHPLLSPSMLLPVADVLRH